MANRNWTRWIHSSIAQYLKAIADTENIASLIEGIEDRDDPFMEAGERVEIRVNGPFTNQPSKGYYTSYVFVNVLATSHMGGATKNKYDLDRTLGIFHEALDQPIPIFNCDDNSHIGCLSIRNGNKLGVRVNHFSQLDPTDRIKQGMVSAAYEIELID